MPWTSELESHGDYLRWLQDLYGNALADRSTRRAALNLMEDAVAARRAAAHDAEQRLLAEGSLRESEARLQRAVEATNLALFEWDLRDDRVAGNPEFHALFGLEPADELGAADAFGSLRVRLLEATTRAGVQELEWARETPAGLRWLLVRVQTDRDADVEGWRLPSRVFGTALDITARKTSEEDLRRAHDELESRVAHRTRELSEANASLAREVREGKAAREQIRTLFVRLINAQEDERRAIARDVHDHLGQQMTALRMALERLRLQTPPSGALADSIEVAQQIATDVDEAIDTLTAHLRPAILDHFGLADALSSFARQWADRVGVGLELCDEVDGDVQLRPEAEVHVYRLVQEALHNIERHARARLVRLAITRDSGALTLRIQDDGCGFDPGAPTEHRGAFGLTSMRERAALAGGDLILHSSPGSGTTLLVRWPIGQSTHADLGNS